MGIVLLVLDVLFIIAAVNATIEVIAYMVATTGGILISGGIIGEFIGIWLIPAVLTYLGIKWVRQK